MTRPYAIHPEYLGSAAIGLEEGYNHTYNHHELPVVSGGGVCYGRSADSVGMLCWLGVFHIQPTRAFTHSNHISLTSIYIYEAF